MKVTNPPCVEWRRDEEPGASVLVIWPEHTVETETGVPCSLGQEIILTEEQADKLADFIKTSKRPSELL